jgi:glucuronoarabinoxylan endo-1,4-beta-xylanase
VYLLAFLASVAVLGCAPGSHAAAGACGKTTGDTSYPTATPPLQLAVAVNLSAVQQVMDGFGGAAATAPAFWIHGMQEPQRTDLVNLLFSTDVGIGLSILRVEVLSGNHDAANNGSTGGGALQPDINTHEPSEGVWDWEGDKCQVWLMQQAQQRGVGRLLSTVWSAPAWMKTNNDYRAVTPNGTLGYLRADKKQAFADYLARYVSEYATRFNVTITHISPTNEPTFLATYQGCLWTAANLTSFIRDYLGPTLNNQSLSPKHRAVIVAPEVPHWGGETDFDNAIVNDSAAAAYVGVLANHGYSQSVFNSPVEPLEPRPASMRQWMTEVCELGGLLGDGIYDALGWARNLHRHVMSGTQAWIWWYVSKPGQSFGSELITQTYNGNVSNFYTLPTRIWALGHYSRFVRPGYVRVDATPDNSSNVFVSAYSGEERSGRQIVVIATNNASQEVALDISIPDLDDAANFTHYITNASMSMEPQLALLKPIGGVVSVLLPPLSISTLVTIPAPIPPAPAANGLVYVSDLPFISASSGVDSVLPVQRDRSCDAFGNCQPASFGVDQKYIYAKALSVASVSRVLVHLGGKCSSFVASIGMHASWVSAAPPATFSVAGDGDVIYKSDPFQRDAQPQNVTVSVAGVNILTLQVTIDDPASYTKADDARPLWANASVLCLH